MTLDDFNSLLTPDGSSAITAASNLMPTDHSFLVAFEKLRKRFEPGLAKAALETVILRQRARAKFPDADRMYFERVALEQSTHPVVAANRALRFARYQTVLDLGCGIGADAMALARAGCRVIAVEHDPLRARIAAANFAALALDITTRNADGLRESLPDADAVFCDPARRDHRGRHLKIDDYSPPPRAVIARFRHKPMAFKLAPGIDRGDLADFVGEIEFVSLNRELKECRLWLGELATTPRRATVLPGGDTLTGEPVARVIAEPREFIGIPDASVVRAGLETILATTLDAAFLDATQPLLTTATEPATPFATAYRFDAIVTGSLHRLNAALRQRSVGHVTWINIGSPRGVESVRRAVTLNGHESRTVILTRLSGRAAALIVHPQAD